MAFRNTLSISHHDIELYPYNYRDYLLKLKHRFHAEDERKIEAMIRGTLKLSRPLPVCYQDVQMASQ